MITWKSFSSFQESIIGTKELEEYGLTINTKSLKYSYKYSTWQLKAGTNNNTEEIDTRYEHTNQVKFSWFYVGFNLKNMEKVFSESHQQSASEMLKHQRTQS